MKNWREIEIPQKMKDLPQDKRGYPIPFTISRDATGTANFSTHDPVVFAQCIHHKLCSICGRPLYSDMWLIAGAKTALERRAVYLDPPVHKQCGTYALQVCPYLAVHSFKKKSSNDLTGDDVGVQIFSGKAAVFAFVKTEDYHVMLHPNGTVIIVPVRPFLDIEYWKEGVQITASQAKMLFRD